jgi:hypothetical protein
MEYNTQRERMPLPEYGRNLQKMVNNVITIGDKEKRTRFAHFLVDIMIQLHPNSKDSDDLRHKLWDHLHIMSNFRLDIESPFPVPDKDALTKQPKPLSYPVRNLRHNYYGRNIQQIIEEACKLEDGEEKNLLTISIANQMKKSYLLWNKDTVDDNLILHHLAEFSGKSLSLPGNIQLKQSSEIVSRPKKKQKPQKGGLRRKNK